MPLTYRDMGVGSQWAVMCGEITVAYIRKQVLSGLADSAARWEWGFPIGSAAPAGFINYGRADTLDEAKGAVEQNWQLWLDAAGLTERR